MAFSMIRSESARGIAEIPGNPAEDVSVALTPSFFAVWVIAIKESLAVVSASEYVCRLTSCLRFSTLVPNSESP